MGSEIVQPGLSGPLTIDPRLIFGGTEPVPSTSSFDHWIGYDETPAPMPNPTSPTSGDMVGVLARGGAVVVY